MPLTAVVSVSWWRCRAWREGLAAAGGAAVDLVAGDRGAAVGRARSRSATTLPLPAVAELSVGGPGAVAGAAGVAERSLEREPSPTEFTALTW